MAMYSEPHRYYHNLLHIEDCLGEFDRAKQLATDPTAVELAIWFHDAVYDPRAADNEERSAELAKAWLSDLHASDALTDSVGRLVLATKSHDASLHADAPLLVDVDLSKSMRKFSVKSACARAEANQFHNSRSRDLR